MIVEHAHAACCNRAHRQLFIAGDAELADDKNIQRCTERAGHFVPDGYAAARRRRHKHVRSIGIGCEFFSEPPARFAAIAKESRLNEYWLHVSSSLVEATLRPSIQFAANHWSNRASRQRSPSRSR